MLTDVLPKFLGSGMVAAVTVPEARPVPKMEMIEPGATAAPAAKLAPFTMPPGLITGVCACAFAQHNAVMHTRINSSRRPERGLWRCATFVAIMIRSEEL